MDAIAQAAPWQNVGLVLATLLVLCVVACELADHMRERARELDHAHPRWEHAHPGDCEATAQDSRGGTL